MSNLDTKPKKFKSQSVNNLFRQQTSIGSKSSLIKSPSPQPSKTLKIKTISSAASKLKIIPNRKSSEFNDVKRTSQANLVSLNSAIANKSASASPSIEKSAWKLPRSRSESPDVEAPDKDNSAGLDVSSIDNTSELEDELVQETPEQKNLYQQPIALSSIKEILLGDVSLPETFSSDFANSNKDPGTSLPRAFQSNSNSFSANSTTESRNSVSLPNSAIPTPLSKPITTPRLTSKFNDTFSQINLNNNFQWADDESDKFWLEIQNSIDEDTTTKQERRVSSHHSSAILGPTNLSSSLSTPQMEGLTRSPLSNGIGSSFSLSSSFFSNQQDNANTQQQPSTTWNNNPTTPVLPDFRRNTAPMLSMNKNNSSNGANFNTHRHTIQPWSTATSSNDAPFGAKFPLDEQFHFNDSNSRYGDHTPPRPELFNPSSGRFEQLDPKDNGYLLKTRSNSNNNHTTQTPGKFLKNTNSFSQSTNMPMTPPRLKESFWNSTENASHIHQSHSHPQLTNNNLNSINNNTNNNNNNVHAGYSERSNSNRSSIWNNETAAVERQDSSIWSPFSNTLYNNANNANGNNNATSSSRFFPTPNELEESPSNNLTFDSFQLANNNSTPLPSHIRLNQNLAGIEGPISYISQESLKLKEGPKEEKEPKSEVTTVKSVHPDKLIVSTKPSFFDEYERKRRVSLSNEEKLNSEISFPSLKVPRTSSEHDQLYVETPTLRKYNSYYPEGFSSTFYKRGINNFMFVRELQPKLTNKFKNDRQYVELRINFPDIDRMEIEDDGEDDNERYYEEGDGYSEDEYYNEYENDGHYEGEGDNYSHGYRSGRRKCYVVNIDVRELEGRITGLKISKNVNSSKKFNSHYNSGYNGTSGYFHGNSKYINPKYTRK